MPKFSIRKVNASYADHELTVTDLKPKNKLQAIESSITKHEIIVKWLEKQDPKSKPLLDTGNDKTCGLCKLYINDDCVDCPVYEVSGERQCHSTPYWDAESADTNKKKLYHEQREVKFLKAVKDYIAAQEKLDTAQSESDKALENVSKLAVQKSDSSLW